MSLGVNNPEIQSKKDELFSLILQEQQKINTIKEADLDKKDLVATKLAEYEKQRGKGFFYNYLSSGRGHGPLTELIDGSVKYDLIGGIGPNLLGHSHPQYIRSVIDAASCDTVMCGNLQTYEAPKKLTNELIESVSKDSKLRNFWFSGSGSFANDVALKILWQKKAPHYDLIAFQKAFAGRSIATQDITFNESYRQGMPKTINVHHALHYDYKDPENATQKTLDSLNQIYAEHKSICAIMIELIQGEGGFIYGPKEYYETIFKWARERDIYIWIDEVQSFARTTELFSYQMYGLGEYVDVLTVGKVLQVCGTFYSEELNPKPGLIAGTFNGSIAAINAGHSIVKFLNENNFYGENGRIKQLEQEFFKHFDRLKSKGKISYYGGVGTMLSFEVGDSSKEYSIDYVKRLFDNGVISFIAGSDPTRIRLLIPVTLTSDHISEIFSIIEKTISEK